jgi:hypothetical protein
MPGVPIWLVDLLGWLERSSIGETVRMTPNLYPILMSAHVLGIALLVGSAFAVDLRFLGVGRSVLPVTVIARYLLPLSHIGFTIAAVTGVAMFTGIALSVGSSAAAPWKFGLIAIAGVNIAIFHTGVYRTVEEWDLHAPTPVRAKAAALVSAFTWTGVIFAGRFLAY